MSFEDDWGQAAPMGGEYVQPRQLEGHLLVIYVLGHIPFVQTKFTVPGKLSDAIQVDVVDLDDKDESGAPGKVYRTCNWMGAIIGNLRPMIGRKVLGTIGKGVGKPGMNAPWNVIDLLENQGAKDRATAWGQANPTFRPSPFNVRDDQQQMPVNQQQGNQQQGNNQNAQGYSNQGSNQGQGYGQQDQGYQNQRHQEQQPQGNQGQGYAAVQGSAQLTDDEINVLQRMRRQQDNRVAQEQQRGAWPQNQDPPF
jgi:hypothetical protein